MYCNTHGRARKEKKRLSLSALMRSQVLYQAAQAWQSYKSNLLTSMPTAMLYLSAGQNLVMQNALDASFLQGTSHSLHYSYTVPMYCTTNRSAVTGGGNARQPWQKCDCGQTSGLEIRGGSRKVELELEYEHKSIPLWLPP